MRLMKPYLTLLLVGLALGRNIGTEKDNENNEAPLLSGAKTLKNNPKTYYGNQMRMKFLNGERTPNTDNIRKPIETAIKEEEIVPSAFVSKLEVVKQPKIEAKLIKKEDTAKVKEPELKEAISDQEIKKHQRGNDKTNAILVVKESLTVANSKNNVKAAAAEPKINKIVKEIKGVPAISNPKVPTKSNENSNLDAVPLGLEDAVLKDEAKEDSDNEKEKIAKSKVGMESKSESSKASETKNKADKFSDKENNDEVKEKETKSSHSSTEVKGDLKMINAEIENNLSKIFKADDAHKIKDKYYEKKRKVDDDDDDSDDEDSSDEDDD